MTKSTSTLREGINKILTEHLYTTIVLPDGHNAQTYVDVTDKLLSLFEKYMKRIIKTEPEPAAYGSVKLVQNVLREEQVLALKKLVGK